MDWFAKLTFPCQPQSIVDFVSDIIGREAIVQLNYQDGCYIRYSYKDFLWDTSDVEYPLVIQGEDSFNCHGYGKKQPGSWLGPHKLISIEVVKGWI